MLVIGYIQHSDKREISIASFHRGPLSLIPDTPVSLALMGGGQSMQHGCEVFVTPFESNTTNLFKFSCTMQDQPGVVGRLLEALSSVQLNVVSQESACVNHHQLHTVRLLLDWSQSHMTEREPVPAQFSHRIQELSHLIPGNDFRYFILLEKVIKSCGDILHWKSDESSINQSPDIKLTPFFTRNHFVAREESKIERAAGRNGKVFVRLPDSILSRVCEHTRFNENDKIPYMILSETNSRTLRVFFPKKGTEKKMVRVAFKHRNYSGAVSAITSLLGASGFNIITSLLRRGDDQRYNIWEAHLEFRGKRGNPPASKENRPSKEYTRKVAEWLHKKLKPNKIRRAEMRRYEVTITTPKYPLGSYDADLEVCLYSEDDDNFPTRVVSLESTFEKTLSRIEADPYFGRRKWLFSLFGPQKGSEPTVFLSFPSTGKRHAEILKSELEGVVEFIEYQKPDLEHLTEKVIELVRSADFFLAIWHHEVDNIKEVSPWMPFEYGIATALGKKTAVIIADTIAKRSWDRIDTDIAKPLYSDLTFSSETVPLVENHIREKWLSV